MTCELLPNAGVYVLGSLDAAERAEYERHLAGCEECSRSVRRLAGLPGLLGRVPLEVLETPGEREPVPETLLPAVVAEARRARRRRAARTATLVAAAVVLLVAGTAAVVTMSVRDDPPGASPPSATTTAPSQEMESLAEGRVSGWVSLTEVAWGTRIDLTCTYGSAGGYGGYGGDGWTSYAMFVHTADGRVEKVGTWRAEAGRETHVSLATAAAAPDIAEVEVRTADGQSVLRLAPAQ
jgi:hypothetical protein